jgi:hypothetical protein
MIFDDIVGAAREATGGLPDPDRDTWQEGLQILLRDHARADMLTARGREIIKRRYVSALASRMQVDDYLRRHPQVLDTPVERPVFILGLVRTGTTMTSYLMDADPANRSLLRWEAYNVAPPAAPGATRSDERCLAEKATDEKLLKENPRMFSTHFEAADGPTECVHLLAQDFRSMMYAALSTVPVYSDWLLECDMSSAFQHRKRVLQVLQSTNPGRWVLKMPSDSVFIHWLFRTFPDARVIWTHRDPYAAFASSFSMRGKSRLIFNRDMDLDFMRCKWPHQLSLHLRRPLEMAKARPDAFYHLYYDEMMRDPMAQMKKVYAWLGDEWTEQAESGMRAWLQENPQNRFGRHSYSLGEWGFTREELEPYFADYLKVHPVAAGAAD